MEHTFRIEFVDASTQIVLREDEFVGSVEEFRERNRIFEMNHPTIDIRIKSIEPMRITFK